MELSNVFDCEKGIAKQLKILKVIGELSTTTILHIWRHLVDYSTILSIVLRHPSEFGFAIRRTFSGGKFACFEDKK